ncbi:phage lysis regulatory protein, LysB family [compost metagenome]
MDKIILAMGAVLVGLLVLANFQAQKLDTAAADARTAEQSIKVLKGEVERQNLAVGALEDALKEERNAQRKLREDQADSSRLLARRKQEIEDLRYENALFKTWADQFLPDDVRRLRERPAIVGAAEYRAWLSGGDPVRPIGYQSSDQ